MIKLYKVEIRPYSEKVKEYIPEFVKLNKNALKLCENFLDSCKNKKTKKHSIDDTKLTYTWKRQFIPELLSSNLSENEIKKYVRNLINEFIQGAITTSGKGPQKYILLILREKELFIIHTSKLKSIGQKTREDIATDFTRLFDPDNMLRFLRFEKENENIYVFAWERGRESIKFSEFLGIEVECEDLGNLVFYIYPAGLSFEIGKRFLMKYETTPEELWNNLHNSSIQFIYAQNKIKIQSIIYNVHKILTKSSLRYEEIKDLSTLWENLILNYMGLWFIKKKVTDEYKKLSVNVQNKDTISFVYLNGEKYEKKSNNSKLLIVCGYKRFQGNELRLDTSLIKEILSKIHNALFSNKPISIMHILEPVNKNEKEQIGCILFYNQISNPYKENVHNFISKIINEKILHKFSKDPFIQELIVLSVLDNYRFLLTQTNFEYLFEELIKMQSHDISVISQENYFPILEIQNLLEYKRGEIWKSKPSKNIDFLVKTIKTNGPFFMIIGIDENTREFRPIKLKNHDTYLDEIISGVNRQLTNYRISIIPINIMNSWQILYIYGHPEVDKHAIQTQNQPK